MGPDQFLYVMSEFAIELDRAKDGQEASKKALAEVSAAPEPGSLRECEVPKEISPEDAATSGSKSGKSDLHSLFNLASTIAKEPDGTEVKQERFSSVFDAEATNHLKDKGVEKVRKEGDATVVSLTKPLVKGDGSGNTITFGEKASKERGSRYEFSLTPVTKNGGMELLTKGVNADTLLGDIPVTSISLKPREGGNISFEIHTDFGSKKGCAFAGTGKEVLEK